ncbi:hypothetical protein CDD80_899 [Ophiocordyceps camponoti-rufipedis]|uniref:Uncharacterized protein n=1 Tax=Ophiocordyceps camponoti-rufipedis TaxID=2004952 RepID=A0A2C5ZD64_9HYPO|nr:hypothetical protein CDD80_899 [Ophiocordyceps camponoti-rufipedis]
MRLFSLAALPALALAQATSNAAYPPTTMTQTSTTLLTKTVFLSRVHAVTSTAAYNTTPAYMPTAANATLITATGTASNMQPTATSTLPAGQVISAAGSVDASPFALSGIAALVAFALL